MTNYDLTWKGRLIVTQTGRTVDLPPDRQEIVGEGTAEERVAFINALQNLLPQSTLFEIIRSKLRSGEIQTRERKDVVLFDATEDGVRWLITGNSNASAGYFYVEARRLESASEGHWTRVRFNEYGADPPAGCDYYTRTYGTVRGRVWREDTDVEWQWDVTHSSSDVTPEDTGSEQTLAEAQSACGNSMRSHVNAYADMYPCAYPNCGAEGTDNVNGQRLCRPHAEEYEAALAVMDREDLS